MKHNHVQICKLIYSQIYTFPCIYYVYYIIYLYGVLLEISISVLGGTCELVSTCSIQKWTKIHAKLHKHAKMSYSQTLRVNKQTEAAVVLATFLPRQQLLRYQNDSLQSWKHWRSHMQLKLGHRGRWPPPRTPFYDLPENKNDEMMITGHIRSLQVNKNATKCFTSAAAHRILA